MRSMRATLLLMLLGTLGVVMSAAGWLSYRAGLQEAGESLGRQRPTTVGLPVFVFVGLGGLWSVDSVEPDALAADFDRVAVDDRCAADQ